MILKSLRLKYLLFVVLAIILAAGAAALAQQTDRPAPEAAADESPAPEESSPNANQTTDGVPITKIPGAEDSEAEDQSAKEEKKGDSNTLIIRKRAGQQDQKEKKDQDNKEEKKAQDREDAKKPKAEQSPLFKRLQAGEIVSVDVGIEGSKVRGAKAMAVIGSHPAIVWEILIDYQGYENYWPDIVTSMLIDKIAVEETIKRKLDTIDEIDNYFDVFVTSPLLDWDNVSGMYSSYLYANIEVPTLPLKWVIAQFDHNEKQFEKGIFAMRWKMLRGDLAVFNGMIKLEPFGDKQIKTLMTISRNLAPSDKDVPASLVYYYPEVHMPLLIRRIRERAKNYEAEYLKRIEEKGRINYVDLGTTAGD